MKIIRFGEIENLKLFFDKSENIFVLGSKGGNLSIELELLKEGIEVNLYGVVVGKENEQFTLKTITKHAVANAKSRVQIKGLFLDSANFNYEGLIRVEENAYLTDAYLKNDNLVIGNNAVVNSAPQLEILNDDVKASHGVTIRYVDEEEKYYLMSRGLEQSQADNLIIKGFINDLLVMLDKEIVESFMEYGLPQYS